MPDNYSTTAPKGNVQRPNNQGALNDDSKVLSVRVLADGTIVSQNDTRITGVTRVGAGTYHVDVENYDGTAIPTTRYGCQGTITDPNQGGIIEVVPDATGLDVLINDADTPAPTDADFCVSFVLDLVATVT